MAAIERYEHGQFSWVDMMAPDAAAAKDFYRELFGWTIDAVDGAPMEYHVITNAGRMNGGIVPWGKELGDVSPNWGF